MIIKVVVPNTEVQLLGPGPAGIVSWNYGGHSFSWDGATLWLVSPGEVCALVEIHQEAHAVQWSVGWASGRAWASLLTAADLRG